MNPHLAKDIRLIAPAWLLTAALMLAASFLPHVGKEWAITIAVFGCLIIAASIFGAEFGHGTISLLLTQPIDRRRIWFQKMLITAAALGSVTLLLLLMESTTWAVAIVAACAFCTIPFFTLIGRGTISGIILSIPIPGVIFLIGGLIALWAVRPSDPDQAINEARLHFWIRGYFGIILPVYCATVYCLGYRRFRRFEIANLAQRQIRLPPSMQMGLEQLVSNLLPARHRQIRVLVAKELHLQHNATIMFLIFAALQLLAIIYIKLARVQDPGPFFTVPLFIYAAIMPLLIGSSAIAEETNLGTRTWHLALPVSLRAQWLTKLCVVFLFTLVFSIGIPMLWFGIGLAFGMVDLELDVAFSLISFCLSELLITAIAFYASSFSRDTLRALLTAFGLCAGLSFIAAGIGAIADDLVRPTMENGRAPTLIIYILIAAWILLGLPLTCLFVLLLRGSFKHFVTLDHRRIWSNVLVVFVSPILLLFFLLGLVIASNTLR